MKKILFFTVLCLSLVVTNAHADMFAPIGLSDKYEASELVAIPGVDPQTVLGEATQILGYLSPKEGMLLDKHGVTNYLSATIVTYAPYGLALNVGTTNIVPDGIAATIDWNLGAYIPSQNVPLLDHLESASIGAGVDYRYMSEDNGDPSWGASWVVTGQVKFTR